jgi:hypothetical protein
MSNQPKRQHTVPKSILLLFSQNERHLFQHRTPIEENEWIEVSAKDASVKKHIYSIYNRDGKRSYVLENAFAKLEGEAMPFLKKVNSDGVESLDRKERSIVSIFLTVQFLRSTKLEDAVNRSFRDWTSMEKISTWIESQTPEMLRRFDFEEVEDYKKKVKCGEVSFEDFGRDFYARIILATSTETIARMIDGMNWRTVKIPIKQQNDLFFITCDNPFSIRRRGKLEEDRIIGLANDKAEFYFPISKHTFLIGSNDANPREGKVGQFRVDELNKITFANRFKTIFSPRPSEYLLRSFEQLKEFCIPAPPNDYFVQ